MKIELGSLVEDKVSGFTGIVTAYAFHLFTGDRVWVCPNAIDGRFVEGCWFDIDSLKILKEPTKELTKKSTHLMEV